MMEGTGFYDVRMVGLSHVLKLYLGVSRGMWCDEGNRVL